MNFRFGKRLALRSAFFVTLGLSIAGTLVVVFTFFNISRHEFAQAHAEHNVLLNTVENTARTAVFLNDSALATEIVQGLMSSESVARAAVTGSEGVLAERSRENISDFSQFTHHRRPLTSPFEPDRVLGELVLVSNDRRLAEEINALARSAALYQTLLVLLIGLSVIMSTHRMVVLPISRLSQRLHRLRVELGEKLETPKGHQVDEIGRLTDDINSMIDHLVDHINREKTQRLAREAGEERLRNIFENAHSGLALLTPDCRLLSCNPAFGDFFQLQPVWNESEPKPIETLLGPTGQLLKEVVSDTLKGDRPRRLQTTLPHNRKRWLEVVGTPTKEGNVELICNDITELKEASTTAETIAVTDPLTGLGNRLGFEKYFNALNKPELLKPRTPFALLYLDLDYFKEVNDTYGHKAGDTVLCKVGQLLQTLTRKTDFIARLGGDEFVVLLENVDSASVATGIAAKLLEKLRSPIEIDDVASARIGASIGIAIGISGSGKGETLIESADSAMYKAKQEGRNRYCLAESVEG